MTDEGKLFAFVLMPFDQPVQVDGFVAVAFASAEDFLGSDALEKRRGGNSARGWDDDSRGSHRCRCGLLQSFSWPGNIRDLQNVIEHSAIVSDESLLHIPPALIAEQRAGVRLESTLDAMLHGSEQQMIELALVEAGGRVSGAMGAAAGPGLPASTLESKITLRD